MTSSAMVFHSPQDGHFPIHLAEVYPHSLHTKTVFFLTGMSVITLFKIIYVPTANSCRHFCLIPVTCQKLSRGRVGQKTTLYRYRRRSYILHQINRIGRFLCLSLI